jgi:hypothetical protein
MNSTFINKLKIFLAILLLFLFSCSQDSIFYDISNEPEPKDPLIDGSPTNIVAVKNKIYAGTRFGNKIFCYANNNGTLGWNTINLPSGYLGQLATDGEDLYALIFQNRDPLNSSEIRKYNISSNSWGTRYSLSSYSIQTIFGAGKRIFAGGQSGANRQDFAIIFFNNATNSLNIIKYGTSLLRGAAQDASGAVYLATAGSGMFIFNISKENSDEISYSTTPVTGTEKANLNGIINVGGNIVAVGADGNVYSNIGGSFNNFNAGVNFTGAMSVWLDRNNQFKPSLLLMGIRGKGSSLTHGYREMILDNGKPSFNIKSPGDDSPTSVVNKAKYAAGIGTHPIESIMQLQDVSNGGPLNYSSYISDPDWEPPIFASTAINGLWAYRKGEWNAEE